MSVDRVGEPTRTVRLRDALPAARDLWVIGAGQVVLTALQLLWVWLLLPQGASLRSRYLLWDARIYVDIARHGYPAGVVITPDGSLVEGSQLAFFPLYPMVVSAVAWVTRMPHEVAALVVSWLALFAFLVALHVLTRLLGADRHGADLAVLCVALWPMSIVLTMGYAESTFALLVAATLVAVLTGHARWSLVLALLASLTRPLGLLLLVPLAVRAVQQRSVAAAAGLAGAVAGFATWWVFVAVRAGRLDGLSRVQEAGWGTRLDLGASTLEAMRGTFLPQGEPSVVQVGAMGLVLLALAVGVALQLHREHWWLASFALPVLAVVLLESNYWHSKPRLLLGGVVLAALMGLRAARRGLHREPLFWAAVGTFTLGTLWFNAYMVDVWRYAI